MKNIKKILVFITFFVMFVMFTGAVSAANDTVSQGDNVSSIIATLNHAIILTNASSMSTESADATSSIKTTNTASSVQATSSDSSAPTIKSTSPSSGATGVSPSVKITVTFSEPVKMGNGWIALANNGGTSIPISTSINGTVLTVTPTNSLAGGRYTLTLHTGSLTAFRQ